jgi:hypothetical protein
MNSNWVYLEQSTSTRVAGYLQQETAITRVELQDTWATVDTLRTYLEQKQSAIIYIIASKPKVHRGQSLFRSIVGELAIRPEDFQEGFLTFV